MYCTETQTLKARKIHVCMSCGEAIQIGDEYKRWRCYDNGDAGTVKMHNECLAAHGYSAFEFEPHGYPRGEAVEN